MTPPTPAGHTPPSIEGFDMAHWQALADRRLDQPWQALPDHVHRSSAGRPWQGLAVWHQVGPVGCLYVPAHSNCVILVRRGNPPQLLQRHRDLVGETLWQRGEAVILPGDTPSFWRSSAVRDNIHIDLAPAWLQPAFGEHIAMGIAIHLVENYALRSEPQSHRTTLVAPQKSGDNT